MGGRTGTQFSDPDDIKFLKVLKGHTKKVTAVAINSDDQQASDDSRCRCNLHVITCYTLSHNSTLVSCHIKDSSSPKAVTGCCRSIQDLLMQLSGSGT